MATIGENLERLRRAVPHRADTGQLYRNEKDKRRLWTRIRIHVVLVSTSNNFKTHQAVFKKADGRDPQGWAAFLRRNFETIYSNVLAWLNVRDGEQAWSVKQVIGWIGEKAKVSRKRKAKRKTKRDKRKPVHSKVAAKRHKAKRPRRAHGKVHLRRRHGNRKR